MKRLSAVIGLTAILSSPPAFAANEPRIAVELLLVVATLAVMLVITWRRRYMALAKKRLYSGKNKRV